MKDERESVSKIKISATDGIPMVSFGANVNDAQNTLSAEVFNIDQNNFTAYYDASHKLIFVLDNTLDERKPNVLLIINKMDDRKWDDILQNDFGVDLESIRPKKDNKYQKLDIDYTGLSVYNRIINEFKLGNSVSNSLIELSDFRNTSVRRIATERLEIANETIANAYETIAQTNLTLNQLQATQKKLRDKRNIIKKEIGKEPTKQSAAKILKTESQIDLVSEKLSRAKKRLANAQRRLKAAGEDAAAANKILGQKQNQKKLIQEEPKVKKMAEEVKPLFEQDPKILDKKIAFKPIEFDAPRFREPEPVFESQNFVAPAPLSFSTPPPPSPVFTPQPVAAPDVFVQQVPEPEPIIAPQRPLAINTPSQEYVASAPTIASLSNKRPALLYYVMLVILIVLSIFTLWLYQKNTVDAVPNLLIGQPTVDATQEQQLPEMIESPFIDAEPAPAPVKVVPARVNPMPIQTQPESLPEDNAVQPEYTDPVPVAQPEYVAPVQVQMEPQPEYAAPVPPAPVVNKPAYDVSGQVSIQSEYMESTQVNDENNIQTEYRDEKVDYTDDAVVPDVNGIQPDYEEEEYTSYESYSAETQDEMR